MKHCSIDGCENGVQARGLCNRHYKRWRAHGDPLGGNERYATPEEAFEARTEPIVGDPAHIIWTGALDGRGYGRLYVNGRVARAHRYAWEREHGPIPDGMEVDHMCWERSCVNPEHLRLATRGQNNAYLSGARKGRMHDLPRGVTPNGRGYRARVGLNGTDHYLGTFDTVESASAAAEAKRAVLFGAFAGGA